MSSYTNATCHLTQTPRVILHTCHVSSYTHATCHLTHMRFGSRSGIGSGGGSGDGSGDGGGDGGGGRGSRGGGAPGSARSSKEEERSSGLALHEHAERLMGQGGRRLRTQAGERMGMGMLKGRGRARWNQEQSGVRRRSRAASRASQRAGEAVTHRVATS